MSEISDVQTKVLEPTDGMTLGKAWLFYLGSLVLFGSSIALATKFATFGLIAILLYPVLGFVMTKVVMGGLIEWHPVYNTIANVFSAKVGMFLVWPWQMLVLLIKMSVNKIL